jgi:diguanylate cyclase (GGDEF)-like protein/PAS domain S-box-containing protein
VSLPSGLTSPADVIARLVAACCGVEAGLVIRGAEGRFTIEGTYGLRGPVERLHGGAVFSATLRRGDLFEVVQRPKTGREHRSGERHLYRFYAGMPIRGADGAPLGLIAVLDPLPRMLEPRAREQFRLLAQGLASLDLRQRHEMLALVARSYECSPEPALVYHGIAGAEPELCFVNRAFARMAGVSAETILAQGLAHFVGAKTDEQVAEAVRIARRAGRAMRATLALYPPEGPPGEPRWFEMSGFPVLSELAGRTFWVETYHDITARTLRISELAGERNRLRSTLASMDSAVVTADRFGKLLFMNSAARRLLDVRGEEASARSIDDGALRLRDIETGAKLIAPLEHARRNGSVVRERATIITGDDERRYVEYAVAPIRRPNRHHDGFVIVMRDVTGEESLTRRLSFEASHDQLTSIFNRRYFDKALQRALYTAKHGDETQHALAFLDLDRFKIINDTCGHPAGDEVLRDLAQLFKAQLRAHDVISRFGGDEFAVLMHDCSSVVAMRVMERIRARLRDYVFRWDGHDFRLGVSIGLAEITSASTSAQELMRQADAACYADKLTRKTKQASIPTVRGGTTSSAVSWLR